MLNIKGVYTIRHFRNNKLLSEETVDNTITNVGLGTVAGLINGISSSTFDAIGLDSSTTVATAGDSALATEITSDSLLRSNATTSRVTTTQTNDTDQLVHTFASTATQAVNGVGVFDTATVSGSTMISRATFATKNLTNGDTLEITHKIQVT